jgi:hypothetical protein
MEEYSVNKVFSLSHIIKIKQDPKFTKLNLGCGQDIRPVENGWVNVDAISHPNIHQLNIFNIPWDIDSDSFDYILAKHVLEHVPHNIDKYGYEKNFMQIFMEEVWRVMKINAILEIEVPTGISSLIKAIDHKRVIVPETFHIFYPDSPWNYYTPCRYELIDTVNEPLMFRVANLRFRVAKYILQKAFCIDVTYLHGKTSIKTRLIDLKSKQHIVRIDNDVMSDPLIFDTSIPKIYDAIVISDYNKGTISYELVEKIIADFAGPVFIDTKKTDLKRFEGAIVKINSLENSFFLLY